MIKITRHKPIYGCCVCCASLTDTNYVEEFEIEFKTKFGQGTQIPLCGKCLNELKDTLNKIN